MMIFVDPVEKYSALYHTVAQRCMNTVKNMQNRVVSFSLGQTVIWTLNPKVFPVIVLNCRYLVNEMLHNILFPESLQNVMKEEEIPPHIAP